MALTSEQIYKLGAESLGWNNTTAAGTIVDALQRYGMHHNSQVLFEK